MRRLDWPERLAEFLASAESRPFVWGETDCCLFVCDVVLAMTDHDLAAEYRGKYLSAIGARRLFDSFEDFIAGVALMNDIAEVPVLCAQRGDVVLFDQEDGPSSIGVVGMHGTHVHSTAEAGSTEIPIANCRRAWRIG